MPFESNVEIPTFKYTMTTLKDEIKRMTYSLCYMCPAKFNCSLETKQQLHCMKNSEAKEILKAIDFAYKIVKEQKKIALQKE